MDSEMAKLDKKPGNTVDFAPFNNADDFYAWVATNLGSDVKESCRIQIEAALADGQSVRAFRLVEKITQATREIDISRTGIKARYAY